MSPSPIMSMIYVPLDQMIKRIEWKEMEKTNEQRATSEHTTDGHTHSHIKRR